MTKNEITTHRFNILSYISLSIGFIFAYFQVFSAMIAQWWTDEMYSYCFLIPLVSFYMIWARRDSLSGVFPAPNCIVGIPILLAGLVMLIGGHAGRVLAIQELSIIPVIVGLIVITLGLVFFSKIWLSVVYLLFMLPIWEVITDRLHLPFQLLSAKIGAILIGGIGIPAYQKGTLLELPRITLEVAEACSGVNYLIAVAALGLPMAHLYLDRWSKKTILICSSIFVAILANGLRIALIGILQHYGITEDIHGPNHIFHGLFVSFIGYVAIFGGLWLLSDNKPRIQASPLRTVDQPSLKHKCSGLKATLLWTTALFLLLLSGSYVHFFRSSQVFLTTDFQTFPKEIGEWVGVDDPSEFRIINLSKADKHLSKIYRLATGEEILAHVGYFEYQGRNKKLLPFNREMLNLHKAAYKFEFTGNRIPPLQINQAIVHNESGNSLVFFWYDINGKIITNPYFGMAYTMWNSLIRGESNGALILVSLRLHDRHDLERRRQTGENFITAFYPVLGNYLPKHK